MMNSIESLKMDFKLQIGELNKIQEQDICDNCIFIGSGDSYVAGLVAEFITNQRCRCYSPSDLFKSTFTKDKTYCFISVTGKTRANIQVARRANLAGAKTVAITFNGKSNLAKTCDEVVSPSIKKRNTPNAGFSTFVANVVTCLQLAGISIPANFNAWQKKAEQISQNFVSSLSVPEQTLYLLGNNTLYPTTLYASMQIAEFFGTTATAHKLEEFSHSPIFGLKQAHHIWVFGQNEEDIGKRIKKVSPHLSYVELYNDDPLAQLFVSIFFVQSLMLLLSKKYRLTELKYITMKRVLQVSSDIIYDKN